MDVNVYQHFRKDEHPFIDNVEEWIGKVSLQYSPFLTNFLDPRQCYVLETLVSTSELVKVQIFGGYENSERRRALIYPDYYSPEGEDFEISLVQINYPKKFTTLSHGKILGTLLNCGIKRDYFGDIITDGDNWQVLIEKEMCRFIINQVTKIGNTSVRLIEIDNGDILIPIDEMKNETLTASSLRLDALVSEVYNISRQRSKQLIEGGQVKVNWVINEKPDYPLDTLDIVSVRKYGRFQLLEDLGLTRKERNRLSVGVFRKK